MIQAAVPHLLLVVPNALASGSFYLVKPLTALVRQRRITFSLVAESKLSLSQLRTADMVLFCRNIEPEYDWVIQECRARRIPTIYHLDDNFWELPSGYRYSEYYQAAHRLAQMERYLRLADRVHVYSPLMLERVRPFNPQVYQLTSCIDLRCLPPAPPPRRPGPLRLSYVTGRGAVDPLIALFADDLQRLLDTYPGQVEVTWWAEVPPRFSDHPSTCIIDLIHDYDQFLHTLATQGFDIGLAPLTATAFNLSKTNTKFRDYGACHIPGIYSDVSVYSDCVEHGKTGLLAPNIPGAWFDAMQRLLTDAPLRETIRTQAYHQVDAYYRQEVAEAQWIETVAQMLPTPASSPLVLPPEGLDALVLDLTLDDVALTAERPLTERPLTERLADAWRSVRQGGQVLLYAPYRRSPAELDEHSPTAWTPAQPPVYQRQENLLAGAVAPAATPAPDFDLRCFEIEFFYQPARLDLNEAERLVLRQRDPQACEYILYRCVAVKQPLSDDELGVCLAQLPPADVPAAATRRAAAHEIEHQSGIHAAYATIHSLEVDLIRRNDAIAICEAELNSQMPLARHLALQVDAYRQRAVVRLLDGLRDRRDYARQLAPAYHKLADDSLLFGGALRGYRLRHSQNLQRVPYLAYRLAVPRSGLKQVWLAPVFELYPRRGQIGIEIMSAGALLVQQQLSAADLRAETPLEFKFPPLAAAGGFELRVFGRDLDVPLRLYEWQSQGRLGLSRVRSRPFVGLSFTGGA